MIKKINIKILPEEAQNEKLIVEYALEEANLKQSDLTDFLITKKSVDSRRIPVKIDVSVTLYIGEKAPSLYNPIEFKQASKDKIIIVGTGPAGLFAALKTLEQGYTPVLIERGEILNERLNSVSSMIKDNSINEQSNFCYGEGGSFALSDGKLFAKSKKKKNSDEVLSLLVQMGAPKSIFNDIRPSLGTDNTPSIIQNIRSLIIEKGGEIHFKTKVVDLIQEENKVVGVVSSEGTKFLGPVILATGHSAGDIYQMLNKNNIPLEAKSIAVGLRVEHSQEIIDRIQYKSKSGKGSYLPAAEYKMAAKVGGRNVYTFYMCPGGFIVPSHTEDGYSCTNGISSSTIEGKWANSAVVTEVRVEDVTKDNNPLAMLDFQRDVERKTYEIVKSGIALPAQRVADFVNIRESRDLPNYSYLGKLVPSELNQVFPPEIAKRLRGGFISFNKKIANFSDANAIVIACETRTSSPVRILRDKETFMSNDGLFPCGEGSGYSGGIVSSALDGVNCALAAIRYIS